MRFQKWHIVLIMIAAGRAQVPSPDFHPVIPRAWDDKEIASLQVPLANPLGSPKHVSADYYYGIPARPIYKSYPLYTPGREPAGYIERLQREDPVVLWDDDGHAPPLATDADWLKAGAIVFDAPLGYIPLPPADILKAVFEAVRFPIAADGTMPFFRLVVRKGRSRSEVMPAPCATPASWRMAPSLKARRAIFRLTANSPFSGFAVPLQRRRTRPSSNRACAPSCECSSPPHG